MQKTIERLRNHQTTTIVVTGDSCSVDTGAEELDTIPHRGTVENLCDGFIYVINSSQCGNNFRTEWERMEVSLLRFRPDLVVFNIPLNAGAAGSFESEKEAARKVIRALQEACGSDVLLTTPNPTVFGFWSPLPERARSGEPYEDYGTHFAAGARALAAPAEKLGLPCVDHYCILS
ncbi:MAG: hypothetical protein AUJ92_08645 [Armatimonadetes bacterium CG2_30_59_28]|nr:SGNH/GDSL hydrolase family protein [Armatimonadota bacterium]OIO95014.1 MAG: hypothetical protein AUJ92_08645 [Armatimonadetes bacterium CG2_30_59_28]PIU67492.1 MAG: hypothetical protein COS85_00245 [Armatimonadetes bacterium CG07_land_8_20_14_0_80_59_28]PJB74437.1 MAG: hypothetical protein CO095_04730 [Armatimonadetes bacterium CG_4_9_14_3_um_filter_58_7]